MVKILLIIAIVILVLLLGAGLMANRYVNDRTIPVNEIANKGDRVLVVFAHPDDEITVAGTLAKLNAKNIPTGVVYLTRGEAGPTGGIVPQEKLGEERAKELRFLKPILGIGYLKIFDYPDSDIKNVQPDEIKKSILDCIAEFKPTIMIGFDETVGLYGHEDHRLAGLYLHELLENNDDLNIARHYMVTLPAPMIKLALKMSAMFKERYPKEPEKGLPAPDVAVDISKFGKFKRSVLEAHKTQREILEDVQPYGMSIPPSIYYRVFDREYFHLVD